MLYCEKEQGSQGRPKTTVSPYVLGMNKNQAIRGQQLVLPTTRW